MLHFPFPLTWIAVAKVPENQQVYRSVAIWIISKVLQSHWSPIFTSLAQSRHEVYASLESYLSTQPGSAPLISCAAMRSTQTVVAICNIFLKFSGRGGERKRQLNFFFFSWEFVFFLGQLNKQKEWYIVKSYISVLYSFTGQLCSVFFIPSHFGVLLVRKKWKYLQEKSAKKENPSAFTEKIERKVKLQQQNNTLL